MLLYEGNNLSWKNKKVVICFSTNNYIPYLEIQLQSVLFEFTVTMLATAFLGCCLSNGQQQSFHFFTVPAPETKNLITISRSIWTKMLLFIIKFYLTNSRKLTADLKSLAAISNSDLCY